MLIAAKNLCHKADGSCRYVSFLLKASNLRGFGTTCSIKMNHCMGVFTFFFCVVCWCVRVIRFFHLFTLCGQELTFALLIIEMVVIMNCMNNYSWLHDCQAFKVHYLGSKWESMRSLANKRDVFYLWPYQKLRSALQPCCVASGW